MSEVVTLLHPHEALQFSSQLLVHNCDLFRNNPTLITIPYTVKSKVSVSELRTFLKSVEGVAIPMNKDNIKGLSELSMEFGFGGLTSILSEFRDFADLTEASTNEDTESHIPLSNANSNSNPEMKHINRVFEDMIRFTVKECTIECNMGQAASLCPSVW
jgi:hypothetical protein